MASDDTLRAELLESPSLRGVSIVSCPDGVPHQALHFLNAHMVGGVDQANTVNGLPETEIDNRVTKELSVFG